MAKKSERIPKAEKKKKKDKKTKETGTIREYGEMIIEVLVIVFFINTFLLQSQTIPTPSMETTMLIGDHLLVNKVAYAPTLGDWDKMLLGKVEMERGMIVTFKGPTEMKKDYVKRLVALPGDILQIKNKKVYINGVPQDEPYTRFENRSHPDPGDNFPMQRPRIIDSLGKKSYLPFYVNQPTGYIDEKRTVKLCEKFKDAVIRDEKTGEMVFKVPDGHLFCMGDNRDHSYDSRFWGPVPESYLIGRPWRIYWSFESDTASYLTEGVKHKAKDIFKTIIEFFPKTRWKRMLKKFE